MDVSRRRVPFSHVLRVVLEIEDDHQLFLVFVVPGECSHERGRLVDPTRGLQCRHPRFKHTLRELARRSSCQRNAEGGERRSGVAQVEPCATHDDRQLDLRLGRQVSDGVLLGQREGTIRPSQTPLAVRHEGKVLVRAVEPTNGSQLT